MRRALKLYRLSPGAQVFVPPARPAQSSARRAVLATILAVAAAAALPARAQDPAADDFERTALGPNWKDGGGGTAAIVNGHDVGTTSGTGVVLLRTNSTFDADQFCEVVLADGKPTNLLTQVFVRVRMIDNARYGFHFNPETDPANPRWEFKYDGVPTAQTRILASVPGPMPAPGDTLRIEVRGASPVVLKGFHNGVEILSATDTNHLRITTRGPVGMVSRRLLGTTAPPNSPVFASWRGGSLGPKLEIRRSDAAATPLTLLFTTSTNRIYTVQCADTLNAPQWWPLTTIAGNGLERSVPLTNSSPQRFYRVLSTAQ